MSLWRNGIASMHVMAFGQKRCSWGCWESFLLTEEVASAVPLDAFLRQRFGRYPVPETAGNAGPPAAPQGAGTCGRPSAEANGTRQLRTLVEQVADLARRFHGLGYNHRDFYCCHVLVREPQPGQFVLHLIDLQRMQRRRYWRRRWVIKDLAQLSYSAPREVVSRTDRLRFLKRYLGVQRLGPRERRWARRILAKHARIARRGIVP
jgi:hypothetical protein